MGSTYNNIIIQIRFVEYIIFGIYRVIPNYNVLLVHDAYIGNNS